MTDEIRTIIEGKAFSKSEENEREFTKVETLQKVQIVLVSQLPVHQLAV